MISKLKAEFAAFFEKVRTMDRKVIIIFISVGVLQTIAWYYTSRRFFRKNFFEDVARVLEGSNIFLIEYLFWFIGDFLVFFVIPVLLIIFVLKEPLKDFGVGFGDVKAGLGITALFLGAMLPIVWFVSASPSFSATYPHLTSAKTDWGVFLIYEAGMLTYMIGWEFVWRGYMTFGLYEKFGYYAVLIQMLPFTILHNGKPSLETFGAVLGGIALGVLALRTRSFIYCVLVHFGVMFSIDTISSLRLRAGDYGVGFDSLINVISEFFRGL